MTLEQALTALGSIFTSLMGYVVTVVNTIIETPVLFIPLGVSLTYSIVRIAKRLFNF